MHNDSIFALRTEDGTEYFNTWNEVLNSVLFDVACIDEIYLDVFNEPIYEYKTGDYELSMSEV